MPSGAFDVESFLLCSGFSPAGEGSDLEGGVRTIRGESAHPQSPSPRESALTLMVWRFS